MSDDTPTSQAVLVVLPAPLVALFPGSEREVRIPAATVGEAIDSLDARWPGMRDRLCDSPAGGSPPHQHLRGR